MKTILMRFCAEALERNGRRHEGLVTRLRFNHPHYVGTRAAQANDLGDLLTGAERDPRRICPHWWPPPSSARRRKPSAPQQRASNRRTSRSAWPQQPTTYGTTDTRRGIRSGLKSVGRPDLSRPR